MAAYRRSMALHAADICCCFRLSADTRPRRRTNIFCCNDEARNRGLWRHPADGVRRAYREINQVGMVVRRIVEAPLSPEMKALRSSIRRKKEEEAVRRPSEPPRRMAPLARLIQRGDIDPDTSAGGSRCP